ncbi:MAG: hypothetical protein AAFU83_02715, partial [Bacteroidota bacterium]
MQPIKVIIDSELESSRDASKRSDLRRKLRKCPQHVGTIENINVSRAGIAEPCASYSDSDESLGETQEGHV